MKKKELKLSNLNAHFINTEDKENASVICTYKLNEKSFQFTVLVKRKKNKTSKYYEDSAKKEIIRLYNCDRLLKRSVTYGNYISGRSLSLKRKFIIGAASFFTLAGVVIGSVLIKLYLDDYIHHQSYWTDEQHDLIDTFEKINPETFYIKASSNLKNEKVIARYNEIIGGDLSKATQKNYFQALHDVVVPDSPYILPTTSADENNPCPEVYRDVGSCTSFALNNDKGKPIMGYNYDWWWVDDFCIAINKPRYLNVDTYECTYGSISFTEARVISLKNNFERSGENMERFLLAPYTVMGGLNDEGLAISVMTVNGSVVDQTGIEDKKDQPIVPSSIIQRLVLDECANVKEAESLIKSFRIKSFSAEEDVGVHFMVADKYGDRAVFEFDSNSVLHVIRIGEKIHDYILDRDDPYYGHELTFHDSGEYEGGTTVHTETLFKNPYYLLSSNFYLLTGGYVCDELCPQAYDPRHDPAIPVTQFLYGPGDNGFWRYKKADDFFHGRRSSEFTNSDAWQLLNQTHYSVQDGDVRYLLKQAHQPYEYKSDWHAGTIMSMFFDLDAGTIKYCSYENFDKVIEFKVERNYGK